MRVYFEKPRTTIGWKGLINDPHLDGSGDVNAGLKLARRLLLDVLGHGHPGRLRVPRSDHPAVHLRSRRPGARSARARRRARSTASSGPACPCRSASRTGPTATSRSRSTPSGRPAARHAFAGIDADGRSAILHTRGNGDCHIILRGGSGAPNYAAEHVAKATELLRAAGLPERMMIDLSHDNSGKDPARQPEVARRSPSQVAAGNSAINGVMIESFLVAGRQDPGPLEYARLRPVDHRRMPRLGDDGRGPGRSRRRGPRAPRRPAEQLGPRRGGTTVRIAVIGLGLIGGSIALAARERLGAETAGWDLDPSALAAAGARGRDRRPEPLDRPGC